MILPIILAALLASPEPPQLTASGQSLIIEFEVGGRSGYRVHPEAPDARSSGITQGIGYDNHANAYQTILIDWKPLGDVFARRLAETHPYYGRSAQQHLKDVADIAVPWINAYDIFTSVDVAREFENGKRSFPGFEGLRPNAQAALISNGFNRGWSVVGAGRIEMRAIKESVPKQDYSEMAKQLRKSIRVWRGTEIERGMTRRRFAEAKLMETP